MKFGGFSQRDEFYICASEKVGGSVVDVHGYIYKL